MFNHIKKKEDIKVVKKLASFLVLMCLLVLFSVGVLGAVPTWVTPASGTTLTRTVNVSCSSDEDGMIGMEFWFLNGTTASATEDWNLVGNDTGVNESSHDFQFNTLTWVDTLSGTLNCTQMYDVGAEMAHRNDTTLSVRLDNNAPTSVVVDVSTSRVEIKSTTGTKASCVGSDVNPDVYKFTLTDPKGELVVTNETADDIDTSRFNLNEIKKFGRYELYCTLCDTASICTDSAVEQITVISPDGVADDDVTAEEEEAEAEREGMSLTLLIIIGLAVIVVIVVVYLMTTKK